MSRVLPILFNTEMVQAILDGRKTVTRRIIKPQPVYSPNDGFHWKGAAYGTDLPSTVKGAAYNFRCAFPYQPGDILYVRETWCKGRIECGEEPDGREALYVSQCMGDEDYIHKEYVQRHKIGMDDVIWKPSIHMPKEAARIFLKVKNVRMECLQDITVEQKEKEGLVSPCCMCRNERDGKCPGKSRLLKDCPIECIDYPFKKLWDSTIKKSDIEKYSWSANPWVWVIEFERCEKPEEWK